MNSIPLQSVQKKVCLVGDFAVGKTSLVRRFVEGIFEDKYLSTIGTKVSRRIITLEQAGRSVELTLLLWDLAGGEKFDRVMASYYRGAAGAILVCDLTRPETLEALLGYADNFWNINPNTPLVLVGNKVDLVEQRVVTDQDLATLAGRCRAPWFTTSAKTGENVELAFRLLGEHIIGFR